MRPLPIMLVSAVLFPVLLSCSDDSPATGGAALIRMVATYQMGFQPIQANALPKATGAATCPTGGPTGTDEPRYSAGDDCDADGGVVAFLTPERFTIAVKRLSLVNGEGGMVDIIPAAPTLAQSRVVDLRQAVTLDSTSLPGGEYTGFEAEFYYCELRMPINDPSDTMNVRIYLSDDDFPSEGSRGHHQGDIVLVDDAGAQMGFVFPGRAWVADSLLAVRTDAIQGAGGTDPQTGHVRGLFGNGSLWNQPSFNQGSASDVFLCRGGLGLSIDGDTRTVTFTFSVLDTWFWEDFDSDGKFDPCQAGDACQANAEWAPLFSPPTATVD